MNTPQFHRCNYLQSSSALFAALATTLILLIPSVSSARIIDPGIPDTVLVSSANIDAGDHFPITVTFVNDEALAGASIGIGWGTTDLTLDSISFIGSAVEDKSPAQRPTLIDNFNSVCLIGFFVVVDPPLPAGKSLFARLWFTADAGAPDQFISLDSTFVPPAGGFILVDAASGEEFVPQYVGGEIKIGNPSQPSTIDTDPTEFSFNGIQGSINPPFQTLNISNIGPGTLSWSATTTESWLTVAPASGTAPSVTQVRASTVGLPVGSYVSEITLTDPNATNSPYTIPVSLEVLEPPPVISVSQSEFFFTAVADSTNPPSQSVTIENSGSSSLNWSATNSESWLTLTPSSGGDFTEASLLVDITGLAFGNYSDTLVITDPAATNSPVKLIVNLSVASDLPIIATNPDSLIVIVDLGATADVDGAKKFDTAYFEIFNDAFGSMTFSLSESSTRISEVTPLTGTAPDSVRVIMLNTGEVSANFQDTIIISSAQAINSPQNFVIVSHLTFNPANISLTKSSLEFNLFECGQGFGYVPSQQIVGVSVFGESIPYSLSHSSEWLTALDPSGFLPGDLRFRVKDLRLALGQYVDTVLIDAPLSENGSQEIIVTLNIIEGNQTPNILPGTELTTLTAKEGSSFQFPPLINVVLVGNLRGGCFEWWAETQTPWLTVSPDTAEGRGAVVLIPDGTSLVFGEYDGEFSILSDEAENSPRQVGVHLKVWRFFGDANYDGRLSIADATYLISYIFSNGAAPEPEIFVGDSDCNGRITISDATFLISYIFSGGDAPCGNP